MDFVYSFVEISNEDRSSLSSACAVKSVLVSAPDVPKVLKKLEEKEMIQREYEQQVKRTKILPTL